MKIKKTICGYCGDKIQGKRYPIKIKVVRNSLYQGKTISYRKIYVDIGCLRYLLRPYAIQ